MAKEGNVTVAGARSITLNIAGFAELMMISNIFSIKYIWWYLAGCVVTYVYVLRDNGTEQ